MSGFSSPAASGAVTSSAFTMATDRLLGRDTAGTGAVEEIDPTAWFTISGGLLVPKFRGARVKKTSAQTADFQTATDITWAEAEVDTDSLWSAGASPRFTIPASLNGRYANVNVQVQITSTTADTMQVLFLQHFDSGNTGLHEAASVTDATSTTVYLNATLLAIPLATGDYFKAQFDEQSDASSTIGANRFTGFAIQIL